MGAQSIQQVQGYDGERAQIIHSVQMWPFHQYLGASPDVVIKCECHGEGLLELKCAVKFGIRIQSPEKL